MPRKLLALVTGLLAAALMFGVVSPATAAPKKPTPKVSLKTPSKSVTVGGKIVFKGKVNTTKAKGAKVAVQRKTSKGWKTVKPVKPAKVTSKAKYSITVKASTVGKHKYRVKVRKVKKTKKAAYSRKVTVITKAKTTAKPTPVPSPDLIALALARADALNEINAFREAREVPAVALDADVNRYAQSYLNFQLRKGSDAGWMDGLPDTYAEIRPLMRSLDGLTVAAVVNAYMSNNYLTGYFLREDTKFGVGCYNGNIVILMAWDTLV